MTARQRPVAPKTPGADASAAAFEIELSCPQCGAPFVATDATLTETCAHCRSLLLVLAPDREEVFVEPPQVKDERAVLESLLLYRIAAQRATLIAKHSDKEGNPPSSLLIDALLSRFEKTLRAKARLVECRLIHVPYRHSAGKVVQTILGRRGDGPKAARVRAYVAEQTLPAYDAARFNLRDAGLRLGRAIFRPLRTADLPNLGRFLPRAAASDSRRDIEKWCGQKLDVEYESVATKGEALVSFEATVYRPYFVVRAILDRQEETLLVDGGFGTIAGYLTESERAALLRGRPVDPLGAADSGFRRVTVTPARCPNCGMDPEMPKDAVVAICRNCHAGVRPGASGLEAVSILREEGTLPSKGAVLLPFWLFPFELAIPGATTVRDLAAWRDVTFPQLLPPRFEPRGDRLFVPAWRLLTTEAGDETFADLARDLHVREWQWTPDRVDLGARPRFVPATLPETEARALARATLFSVHSKTSAARLNTLLVKRTLFDAALKTGGGTLALLAFKDEGARWTRPGVAVPRLLIEGGPALAAQRVSVQSAAAAVAAEASRPSALQRLREARQRGEE